MAVGPAMHPACAAHSRPTLAGSWATQDSTGKQCCGEGRRDAGRSSRCGGQREAGPRPAGMPSAAHNAARSLPAAACVVRSACSSPAQQPFPPRRSCTTSTHLAPGHPASCWPSTWPCWEPPWATPAPAPPPMARWQRRHAKAPRQQGRWRAQPTVRQGRQQRLQRLRGVAHGRLLVLAAEPRCCSARCLVLVALRALPDPPRV